MAWAFVGANFRLPTDATRVKYVIMYVDESASEEGQIMEIPVNANVRCADGCCGRSTHVVINLQTQQVTHLVVRAKGLPNAECLVPVRLVVETTADLIRLSCTRGDLTRLMPFTQIEWRATAPDCDVRLVGRIIKHTSLIQPSSYPVKRSLVPSGELVVGQNTRLETFDGHGGRVEKLLVDPADGRIIRFVLRAGRLWSRKVMIVPFCRIARVGREAVSLELDVSSVELSSAMPVGL